MTFDLSLPASSDVYISGKQAKYIYTKHSLWFSADKKVGFQVKSPFLSASRAPIIFELGSSLSTQFTNKTVILPLSSHFCRFSFLFFFLVFYDLLSVSSDAPDKSW